MAINPVNGSGTQVQAQDYQQKTVDYQQKAEKGDMRKLSYETDSISLQFQPSAMGMLDGINEERNRLAQGIRITDTALGQVSNVVEKMKAQLEIIVKSWPPFNQDSVERKEILMGYVSLRKEIEKLTVPPPPRPIYERNSLLWDKLGTTGNGSLSGQVPEISASVTDGGIHEAVRGLDILLSSIAAGRHEISSAVME